MINLAILSSHNGSGFDAIYEAIEQKKLLINISFIVSNNTHAPVLQKAQKRSINHYVINAKNTSNPDEAIYELLQKHRCKQIFLAGYMKKLSPLLTKNFLIINSHPSLLPKYGGAGMYGRHVHEAVFKNREKISGVSIHKVDGAYDSGEIIFQKSINIQNLNSVEEIEERIKELEFQSIPKALLLCLK